MIALAVAPALLPRRLFRAAAAGVALVASASVAFRISPLDARPFDDRDFFGPLLTRASKGFLDFYDVAVPFNPHEHALMHGEVLLATFAFTLLCALAVAERRPLAAASALVAGAGWPATLASSSGGLGRGALILGAALLLFAGLRPSERRIHGAAHAAIAGGSVIALALALSASPSIAKGAFLDWREWDIYNRPELPVTVRYLWDANYVGISFPKDQTTVLKIKAPKQAVYWRATTLDYFLDDRWIESLSPVPELRSGEMDVLADDVLVPARARERRRWLRAEVEVQALEDTHLIGASVPVAFERGTTRDVDYYSGGVALAPEGLTRGDRYTVWSYAPRPTPARLAQSRSAYPAAVSYRGYLSVVPGVFVPPFGAPDREAMLEELFGYHPDVAEYRPLYEEARRVVGTPTNPYAAVVALEAYFRRNGEFLYDERPGLRRGSPPLVDFLLRTKRGYCQHFAGAMALMLRYLGIPARVAVGFTGGRYDDDRDTWTVYDRNAHAWVEVWFEGFGWLPFDPTPGRGNLAGSYTVASLAFNQAQAMRLMGEFAADLVRESSPREQQARGEDGGTAGAGRGASGRERGAGLLGLLAGVAALLVVLVTLAKLVRRRIRYLTRDPRRTAAACRRELVEFLADQRIDVPGSATLPEVAALIREELRVDARRFAHVAETGRFAPPATAAPAARDARRELRRVLRAVRASLGAIERLRGLVSIRSFASR